MWIHFIFPGAHGNPPGAPTPGYGEAGLDISRSLGFVNLAHESNDAFGGFAKGCYLWAGVEKSFGLTDSISLVFGVDVVYSGNSFSILTANDSGWNHH